MMMQDVFCAEGDPGFVRVCAVAEVPELMPRKVHVEGRALLVCRDESAGQGPAFYAVDELCPHKLESMAYGLVHEGKIVCPHHQYAFDLETGRSSMRRCPALGVYETKIRGEAVWVRIPGIRHLEEEE